MPTPATAPGSPFVLFVSSIEGHLVQRYGLAPHNPIGARYDDKGAPVWELDHVAALSAGEVAQYGHLYERAIREGALKRRSAIEWDAQRKAQHEAHEKGMKEQKAAEEKAAAEAAKAEKAAAKDTLKDSGAAGKE